MKAPRLHEVTARVVAWHNRHPLARRITPTQVHSIGEVQLPFASAQPWAGVGAPAATPTAAPPAAASTPTLAQALAQRGARQTANPDAAGIDGLEVQSLLPEDAAAAPPPPAAVDLALDATNLGQPIDGDGEAALVIPLLDGDDSSAAVPSQPAPVETEAAAAAAADQAAAPPQDAPAAAAASHPPSHGSVPPSALARAVERRAAARAAGTSPAADPPDNAVAAAPTGSRWQRLVDALRRALPGRQAGLPPLRAAFSRDFIWPLRPRQVARWAQRHGQPQPLAPADWPRRCIETDRQRLAALRRAGQAHDLPLHVLTAAIGVGDRRIRVLLGADGSVLGPRAYDHARLGAAATLLALGLVGAGWGLRPLHGGHGEDVAAVLAAAPAASAASTAVADTPATGETAASAAQLADAATAAPAADAASAVAEADAAGAPTPAVADAAASQPPSDIRPTLSDEQKYAARVDAAKLRGETPPPPPAEANPGPVYAVVSPPSRQRDAAAGSLALMQATADRLDGPTPGHGELLQSQGQWRAAWWPFASLADAERARVLLAGRGLKAEVVEF